MSSQQLASNNGPNRKVPICNLHRLPMRQFSVKKEGPNKGKLFWNCQQAGDFCKSFLWDHDIESKPNSWKLEFLVNPDNNSESRPAIASAYKLVFELVTRGHIEAKILPALQDKSLAAAVSEFVTGNPHPNNPCCWRIPTHHYHAFLNVITKNLAQYNVEVSSLPEWIMKRYVEGAVVPKTFAFDKNRVPKELWSRLLPFQRDGVQQIVAKFDGRCIIADEMGLGKTVQAVALMSYYGDDLPALIVAPSSIRFHWKDTLLNWLPNLDEERIHVINSGTDWPKYEDSINFMIISYALLSKFQTKIQSWNPSFVVLDESHFIKTLTTQRSLAAAPIIKSSRRAILLSGTPATSRPSELFSQVDVLHHGMLGSYKQYGIRYCDGREGNFGWECRGARCLRELNLLLTDAVMIRRLKKDVMQDLPPKFRSGITISSLPASAAAEFKLKLKAIKGLESGTSENNGILATLYHDTGVVKIKDAASFVTTKLDSSDSEKFLIFAHHQDVIDGIENELRKGAASGSIVTRIDGNTNMVSRKSIVEKFQSDSRYRVLILSIKAASFGITLTAASNVLFAELAWSPQDLLQAEDRAHRIGQEKSHVNISYLLAKGTLDDIMWPMIQRKLSVCNTTIDAGRGDIINVDFQNDRSEIEQQRAPKRQRNGSISVRGPMDQFVSSTPRFKSDDLTQQSRSQSSADDVKDQIDLSQSSCSQPISSTQGSSKSRTHSLSLDVVDLT